MLQGVAKNWKKIKNKIVLKRIKHLGITLTKEVWDLHTENYKMPWKDIKNLNKCRDIPCPWIGRVNMEIFY